MKISEWLHRYVEQIKIAAPGATGNQALRIAILSLGAQLDATVITDLPPEDYADADAEILHED